MILIDHNIIQDLNHQLLLNKDKKAHGINHQIFQNLEKNHRQNLSKIIYKKMKALEHPDQ